MRTFALVCSVILGASFLSFPAAAQHKTAKACQEEWRAKKADFQAKGITEKAYVTQCRSAAGAATPAPAAPAASTKPKATQSAAPASSAARPSPPAAATAPTGANQYSTEAQAKARCGSATVVWVNLGSKIYHFAGHKSYGHTKSGAYMCESNAMNESMRAAKNEKHP